MIKFYYHATPNPAKVALFLEEAALAYEVVPIDTRKGEQHAPAFLTINPNAKLPALVDGDAVIFDSSAILLYLAEKSGKFLPEKTDKARGRLLSWLAFISSGVGPYTGQAVHFMHFAPEPKEYAVNRYTFEAERHWTILDRELATSRYMMGDTYTILDMSIWGWARAVPFLFGSDAWEKFPNVKRLVDDINTRPAVAKVGELAARYTFKTEMDEEARDHMFPQNKRLKKAQ